MYRRQTKKDGFEKNDIAITLRKVFQKFISNSFTYVLLIYTSQKFYLEIQFWLMKSSLFFTKRF